MELARLTLGKCKSKLDITRLKTERSGVGSLLNKDHNFVLNYYYFLFILLCPSDALKSTYGVTVL